MAEGFNEGITQIFCGDMKIILTHKGNLTLPLLVATTSNLRKFNSSRLSV